jgi:hypothetical protein
MFRLATFVALQIALLSVALESTWAAEYGTADEAKAMLERAVAAVKEDKAKALDMFSKGEGGFKDRDLLELGKREQHVPLRAGTISCPASVTPETGP